MNGSPTHVWGWSYRTLEGHVEMGEMAWEVWKRAATGEVEFHVHSHSRRAPISNPFVNLGFRLTSTRERRIFLDNTKRRMLALTSAALQARGNSPEQTSDRTASVHRPHAPAGAFTPPYSYGSRDVQPGYESQLPTPEPGGRDPWTDDD